MCGADCKPGASGENFRKFSISTRGLDRCPVSLYSVTVNEVAACAIAFNSHAQQSLCATTINDANAAIRLPEHLLADSRVDRSLPNSIG